MKKLIIILALISLIFTLTNKEEDYVIIPKDSIRFRIIPPIRANAVAENEIIEPPNIKPLMPRDKTVETIIKFFWIFKSVFWSILIPEQAMKPYNIIAAPANTQLGILAIKAWTGAKKPNKISIIAAPAVTLVEATLLKPTQATPSP